MRTRRQVLTAVVLAFAGGCTQPVVLTPCREARELRARAEAEPDSFARSVIEAKAVAAQERCDHEAARNAERGYQAEKRRHQAEAVERE